MRRVAIGLVDYSQPVIVARAIALLNARQGSALTLFATRRMAYAGRSQYDLGCQHISMASGESFAGSAASLR